MIDFAQESQPKSDISVSAISLNLVRIIYRKLLEPLGRKMGSLVP
jgi:hypothetical protein